MKHTAQFLMVGVTLLPLRLAIGDSSGGLAEQETESADSALASPEDQAKQSALNLLGDRRLAVGARFGLFPPMFSALEVTVRLLRHFALSAYGLYLPDGVGIVNRGRQFTLAGNLVVEMAEGRRSGWYFSLGAVYYHAFKDAQGFYETILTLPMTGGYLFKSEGFELQLGAGAQFVAADELPPCTGWICLRFGPPPILPALDLALRYAF